MRKQSKRFAAAILAAILTVTAVPEITLAGDIPSEKQIQEEAVPLTEESEIRDENDGIQPEEDKFRTEEKDVQPEEAILQITDESAPPEEPDMQTSYDSAPQADNAVLLDVNPAKATEAISKFTEAMSKFTADTSKLSGMQSFLTRLGGLTAAAAGVIGVLQMTGVIQDPTMAALGKILDTVKDIQTQISNLDAKVDALSQKLDIIAAAQEEKARSSKALSMRHYWNGFNTNYVEKLNDKMNIYQGMINDAIKEWWNQSSHDGVRVLYHRTETDDSTDGKEVVKIDSPLTYSSRPYAEGFPDQADNGESVTKNYSLAVPGEFLDEICSSADFSIDEYRSVFIEKMSQKFSEGISEAWKQEKYVFGDTSRDFYYDFQFFYWESDSANADIKKKIAEQHAADILNTIIYHIACDTMSSNNSWVIEVTNLYGNYCKNLLTPDSGVDAFLNYIYLTYGFEGEAREDIEEFCDAMIAQAGYFGQFALTCAGQDNMQSKEDRKDIQEKFVNTVLSLSTMKEKALTGHDNYCYITGTVVERATVSANAESKVHLHNGACDTLKGFTSKDWSVSVPNIINNVYALVLYHQYQTQPEGASSFAAYLHKYGAFNSDRNAELMTTYGGSHEFAFSEGIRMKARIEYAGESYFTAGNYYNIDVGTGSKVEQKYYRVHDKVLFDAFDMGSGTVSENKLAGARAYYGESHGAWITDEAWAFCTDGLEKANLISGSPWDDYYITHKYRIDFTVLKQTAVHDLNGNDPENPFLAFSAPSLTPGVSDVIGSVYEDMETPITKVVLESGSYGYTGKAVKPKVTVKAGNKTVPGSGYTVSYMDNKAVGYGTVTVKARGKYSGIICKSFKIVPKGTTLSTVTRQNTAATVRWKKQSAKMPSGRITGYQIRYSTNSSMTNAKKVTVKGYKNISAAIKKLKKNKKYYFQVRTYVKTKKGNLYSGWSAKKAVK